MIAPLRVLIGCETSGVMRRAFAARGRDAWFCDLLAAEDGSIHRASPGPDRWKLRSRTFQGIANACADQWGGAAQQEERA